MKKLLAIVVALFVAQLSIAQIPEPKQNTYVNDFAGVLTTQQVTDLNRDIFKIEKQAGVQMAIVLVKKIPSTYDIQDFAVLIGKKWHIGKNKRGLVYVAAMDTHRQRLEAARGIDSIFNGKECLAILNAMKPSFKSGDYNAGLALLVSQVSDQLDVKADGGVAANQTASTPATAVNPQAGQTDSTDTLIGAIFVIGIILLLVIWYIRRRNKRRAMQNFYNNAGANNPGFYNTPSNPGYPNQSYPNQGYPNQGYGNPGYPYPQQDHTLRNIAAGAVLGAAAGYAGRAIQDGLNNNSVTQNQNNNYNSQPNNYVQDNNPGNNNPPDDNQPSNWGNWGDGGSSNDSSSYDSGFSDDSDSNRSSSSDDSSSSDSGADTSW